MKHTLPSRLVLLAALLGGTGSGLVAQAGTKLDNTAYGTTAAEFMLLGAGVPRGTALGGAYAAVANDASALYYNPAGAALMTRPGMVIGTYDYIADTRYSWGGVAFPFDGGSKTVGFQLGTFGFKDQPVYTVEDPASAGRNTVKPFGVLAGKIIDLKLLISTNGKSAHLLGLKRICRELEIVVAQLIFTGAQLIRGLPTQDRT